MLHLGGMVPTPQASSVIKIPRETAYINEFFTRVNVTNMLLMSRKLLIPCLAKIIGILSLTTLSRGQGEVVDVSELVDSPGATWEHTPAVRFSATSAVNSHDGNDALAIAWTTNASPAELKTTVTGPALVTWWWRRNGTNAAPRIAFQFLLNGTRLADHDEEKIWEKLSLQIPAGNHSLVWKIPQTATSFWPDQTAVLDEVTITPGARLPEAAALNDPDGTWLRTEREAAWSVTQNTHTMESARWKLGALLIENQWGFAGLSKDQPRYHGGGNFRVEIPISGRRSYALRPQRTQIC